MVFPCCASSIFWCSASHLHCSFFRYFFFFFFFCEGSFKSFCLWNASAESASVFNYTTNTTFSLITKWGEMRSRSWKKTDRSLRLIFFFREPAVFQEPLMLSASTLSECRSHSITLWSSPLPLSAEAFSLRKPTGADSAALAVISGNREIEGESLPPLYCARVSVFQLMSCLKLETVGIWDTLLCNAIFKENLT